MSKTFTEIDLLQKEINALRPLDKETVKELQNYYKIGLTYSSNAIEGNSLTETETKIILEEGITVGGKPIRDYFEAIGHSKACDFIHKISNAHDIEETHVKNLHKLFYGFIDTKEAGKYRKRKVFISGSQYSVPAPEKVPGLMKKFIEDMDYIRKDIHPVKFAALVHKEFVFIHPFVDGNGRVARLLMNLVLLQEGYSIAIIPPVLRNEYITLLEKAHKDDCDFVEFIAQRVKETQKDYLRLLKS